MHKLNQNSSSITRILDGAFIPTDEANSDYAAYLKWLAEGNTPEPADVPSAAAIKVTNIKKVDADVDAIYSQAVGNRSLEYTTAEAQAQAYKDAGYTGTVPAFVASWVTASGLTATAAADNILAQAVAWRGAVSAIRAQRLMAKTNITNDVPTAMAQWDGFVAVIRGQLGL
jgi:hypothetical protein